MPAVPRIVNRRVPCSTHCEIAASSWSRPNRRVPNVASDRKADEVGPNMSNQGAVTPEASQLTSPAWAWRALHDLCTRAVRESCSERFGRLQQHERELVTGRR